MPSFIDLHVAQVRTRANKRALFYSTLQHLIASITKAGHIYGNALMDNYYVAERKEWKTGNIKIILAPGPKTSIDKPFKEPSAYIHFVTYR